MDLQNNLSCSTEQMPTETGGKASALQPRLYADPQYIFSLFGRGFFSKKQNKWVPPSKPQQVVDVSWTGAYIKSDRAKWATEELRRIKGTASDPDIRNFKLREFESVAASGTFTYRNANSLLTRSRYITLDIDDLSSTEEAREVQQALVAERQIDTALCFVSPTGPGVKWIVELPKWCQYMPFAEQYASLSRHVGFEYGIQADPACSDVCRLCFLPYDPKCYINPKYLVS